MRTQHLLVAAVIGVLAMGEPGSADDRPIDIERSTVTVRVFKAGLFRAFADNHIVQAPLADGSLDDSATPRVRIEIDARRLRVLDPGLSEKDRHQVQTRMLGPDVLDADRFERISFQSTAIQPLALGRWLVRGELELRGRIRGILFNVRDENGRYKGSATVKQTDFGISPISIVGGTVRVKDEIQVDFDVATTERAFVRADR
jgi:hypothetical protein